MVKKFFGIFMAALLVLGFAGQSLAAFVDGNLIRVVHKQDGTIEIGTDLGTVSSLVGGSDVVVGGGSGSFRNFATGSIGAYYVTYFADLTQNPTANSDVWVSGTGPQTAGNRKYTGYNAANSTVQGYYTGLAATGGTVVGNGSELTSFWKNIDKGGGGNLGLFAGYLASANGSEINLAALATAGGYVDQYLYFFANPENAVAGVQVAVLRTMADGSTIINPSAPVVPIPASVLLLGSGLLGLIGIRRKAS